MQASERYLEVALLKRVAPNGYDVAQRFLRSLRPRLLGSAALNASTRRRTSASNLWHGGTGASTIGQRSGLPSSPWTRRASTPNRKPFPGHHRLRFQASSRERPHREVASSSTRATRHKPPSRSRPPNAALSARYPRSLRRNCDRGRLHGRAPCDFGFAKPTRSGSTEFSRFAAGLQRCPEGLVAVTVYWWTQMTVPCFSQSIPRPVMLCYTLSPCDRSVVFCLCHRQRSRIRVMQPSKEGNSG